MTSGGVGKTARAFGIMGVVDVLDVFERMDSDREIVENAIGSGILGG
jgi:hypothetical protein